MLKAVGYTVLILLAQNGYTSTKELSRRTICDFEEDMCFWKNTETTDFNWVRHRSSIATTSEPTAVHAMQGNWFLYAAKRNGTSAIIYSPKITPVKGGMCMSYRIYKWEPKNDTCINKVVWRVLPNGEKVDIFTKAMNQVWMYKSHDLLFENRFRLKIHVERDCESDYGVGLDNIEFTPGPCSDRCEQKYREYDGKVFKTLRNMTSWEACSNECQKYPQCLVWTVSYKGFFCRLFNENLGMMSAYHKYKISGLRSCVGTGVRKIPFGVLFDDGMKLDAPAPVRKGRTALSHSTGFFINRNILLQTRVSTTHACYKQCLQDERCRSFSFSQSKSRCLTSSKTKSECRPVYKNGYQYFEVT